MYNGILSNTMTSCNNFIDDTIDICCHNLQITCQLPVHVSVCLFQVDLKIRSLFHGVRVSHITVVASVGWATQSKDCIDNNNNNDTCYCTFDIHISIINPCISIWYNQSQYQVEYTNTHALCLVRISMFVEKAFWVA
jgi:hypothetical protein